MTFILDEQLELQLEKPLADIDKGVTRVLVDVSPDHLGEDRLHFRVVLRDGVVPARPSAAFGKRLQKISAALRDRAVRLKVPLSALVDFVLESELPRQKRKIA